MQASQPQGSAASTDPPGGVVASEDFEPAHAELRADSSVQFELKPVDSAHAELRADSSIQFELKPVDPPRLPRRTERQIEPSAIRSSTSAGPAIEALFWVVIALAAAGLLYLIVRRLAGWQRTRRDRAPGAEPIWRMEEAPARQLLGDADALAAEGRYSEAAHLLLHRSIAEIDRRRPASIRKALTSRDIAALPSIPPSPADAFRAIVAAVERSLFGKHPLDAADWRHCRAAYERFAFADGWRG